MVECWLPMVKCIIALLFCESHFISRYIRILLILSSRSVCEALIYGSWVLGQALAYAPNMNSAMISAGRLFQILDRVPKYGSTAITQVEKVSIYV